MEFKGLDLDNHPLKTQEGTWALARNMLMARGFQILQNEPGFTLDITKVNGVVKDHLDMPTIGIIKTSLNYIVFTTDNVDREIGIVTNGLYQTIINDPLLGFKMNNPIEGLHYYTFNKELIIVWCDGVNDDSNQISILNVTNPDVNIDPITFNLVTPSQINLLRLFPDYTIPILTSCNVLDGGNLRTGSYQVTLSYGLSSIDYINYNNLTNPIPINDDNYSLAFDLIDGAPPNTPSNKSIKLEYNNIDTVFGYVSLVVIAKIDGVIIAYRKDSQPIVGSSMTFSVNNLDDFEAIDYREVLIPTEVYTKAKSMVMLDSKLYLAYVLKQEEIDYQKYVNNIRIRYIRDLSEREVVLTPGAVNNAQSSYKNASVCVFDKGFMSDEVYAFYIRLLFTNGTSSKQFHIPGRRAYNYGVPNIPNNDPTGTGERELITPVVGYTDFASGIRKFQIHDTSIDVSGGVYGEMGFWENEDEFYPTGDDFKVFDESEILVDTIEGERVRHHRFPSLSKLHDDTVNSPFTHRETGGLGGDYISSIPMGISVENIYIPTELRDKVQAYEISYAKRDTTNSIIIDKSLIFDWNWETGYYTGGDHDIDSIRFHGFNMLRNKLQINPTYLKNYFVLYGPKSSADDDGNLINEDLINMLDITIATPVVTAIVEGNTDQFRKLLLGRYFQRDNSATSPLSNQFREECFWADITVNIVLVPYGGGGDFVTCYSALCNYRKECYTNYTAQTIVSTGKIVLLNTSINTYQADQFIWGGDIFLGGYGVKLIEASAGDRHVVFYFPCESVDNLQYRHQTDDGLSSYYPRTTQILAVDDSKYEYNADYTSLNELLQYEVNPLIQVRGANTNIFPYRLPFSESNQTESLAIFIRKFKANNYYEMERDKGVISFIRAYDKALLIQMEHTLYIATIKDKLATNIIELYVGVGEIFDRKPDDVLSIPEGYVGSTSQFACFVYKIGYLIVDRQSGKVFLFSGKLKEISNDGVRDYLKNNLQTSLIDTNIDNPFTQIGLTSAYDESNNRLLIGKVDYQRTPLAQTMFENNVITYNEDDHFHYSTQQLYEPSSTYLFDGYPGAFTLNYIKINGVTYTPNTSISSNDVSTMRAFLRTLPGITQFYTVTGSGGDGGYIIFTKLSNTTVIKVKVNSNAFEDDALSAGANIATSTVIYTTTIPSNRTIIQIGDGIALPGSLAEINKVVTNAQGIQDTLNISFKDHVLVTYIGTTLTITFRNCSDNFFLADAFDLLIRTNNGDFLPTVTTSAFVDLDYDSIGIIPYTDTNYFINKGFTLSYSPVKNMWIAYHDYKPNFMFNNREDLYSINNIPTKSDIYKHNHTNRGTYYDGIVYPSYVDIIIKSDDKVSQIFDNISWISEVRDNSGNISYNKTATHIMLYSDIQCSGEVLVISNPTAWYKQNARYVIGHWNFDDFIDVVINSSVKFLDDEGAVITTNLDNAKAWYNKNLFAGKFGILRIIYDNSDQLQFDLLDVAVNTDEVK